MGHEVLDRLSARYGFRFSVIDGCVLVLAAVTAGYLATIPLLLLLAFLIVMVVGHFFLFCNVVRLHRIFELTWAGLFIANCVLWWGWREDLRVLPVLLTQLPVTLLLLGIELRSWRYHGVGARKINPRLAEYLLAQEREAASRTA